MITEPSAPQSPDESAEPHQRAFTWTVLPAPNFDVAPALRNVLVDAQARRFLGTNVTIDAHVANGAAFAGLIVGGHIAAHARHASEPLTIVDLGSGGGVPALVVAMAIPTATIVLIERSTKRGDFLCDAVVDLGLGGRVQVVVANAEEAARDGSFSETADVVTARSFAPPAVTAEVACRFLRLGGRLIVSEPPPDASRPSRWPEAALRPTGLTPTEMFRLGDHTLQELHRVGPYEERLPRGAAATRKRPLFN